MSLIPGPPPLAKLWVHDLVPERARRVRVSSRVRSFRLPARGAYRRGMAGTRIRSSKWGSRCSTRAARSAIALAARWVAAPF